MSSVTDVAGGDTPNAGRVQWNSNINALNTDVISNSAALSAAGTLVGISNTQTLSNKTLVSTSRGGTNTLSISRKDLETASFILVASDSGTVSNMNVSGASQYTLQILGGNGLTTAVTGNVLYIKSSILSLLNESSQQFGVGVSGVTAGVVAEFGGNVIVDNFLGVGSGHTVAPSNTLHVKTTVPTLELEGTSNTTALLRFQGTANDVLLTAGFPAITYLDLRINSTRIIDWRVGEITLDQNATFVGANNTVQGNLEVLGTLTAASLSATATDVIINTGIVTILGGTTYIADGAIPYDKLAASNPGEFLIGATTSGILTTTPISGDIEASTSVPGQFTIVSGIVGMSKLDNQPIHTILGGIGTGVRSMTSHSSGDITFTKFGGTNELVFNIDNDVILNSHISSGAAITMNKTNFNTTISGIEYINTTGTFALAPSVPSDFFFRSIPAGTIITYAGTTAGLSDTGLIQPVTGWLFCNGETFTQGAYPALYEALGGAWGTGTLPDLQGAFLRGVDPSNLVDTESRSGGDGDGIGSYQADAIASHRHDIQQFSTNIETGGPYIATFKNSSGGQQRTGFTGGAETRPLNYGIAYLIKY